MSAQIIPLRPAKNLERLYAVENRKSLDAFERMGAERLIWDKIAEFSEKYGKHAANEMLVAHSVKLSVL